jgi:hypothetical protein
VYQHCKVSLLAAERRRGVIDEQQTGLLFAMHGGHERCTAATGYQPEARGAIILQPMQQFIEAVTLNQGSLATDNRSIISLTTIFETSWTP